MLSVIAAAACSHGSGVALAVPRGRMPDFKTTIQEGYVGTDYAFGILPLGVAKRTRSVILDVHLTGLDPSVDQRVAGVSRTTSPGPLGALVGTPETQDPARFQLLPVDTFQVKLDDDGIESGYLVAILTPHRKGAFTSTGVDVTFRDRASGRKTVHYQYQVGVIVNHAAGRDPRLDVYGRMAPRPAPTSS